MANPEASREEEVKKWELITKAQSYLSDFGLELKDIEGKRVLDIGSNDSRLEAGARTAGVTGVVSLDKSTAFMKEKGYDLEGRVAGNVRQMPFADNTFDLVLVRAAPPVAATRNEKHAVATLDEINRVLSGKAEGLLWPPYLYFIYGPLCDEDPELKRIISERDPALKGGGEKFQEARAQRLKQLSKIAFEASVRYLREKGFPVEPRKKAGAKEDDTVYGQFVLVMKKNQAEK